MERWLQTHRHGIAQWNAQQTELRRLRLLVEAMQIKAKGEPTFLWPKSNDASPTKRRLPMWEKAFQ
jgi:hypothetical protein